MMVPISLPRLQQLLLYVFFYYSHLVGVTWYLVVLIFISLKTNDSKLIFHVLIGHLYIFFGEILFLGKCLKSLAHL